MMLYSIVLRANEALQATRGRAYFQAPVYVGVRSGLPAVVSPRAPERER
jgi:hypothetical protein